MRRSQSKGCAGGGGGDVGATGRRGGGVAGGATRDGAATGGVGATTGDGGATTVGGGTPTGGGDGGATTGGGGATKGSGAVCAGCGAAACGVSATVLVRTSRSRLESSSMERCCCSSSSSRRRRRLLRPACETRLQIGRMNGTRRSRMPKKTTPSTLLSTSTDAHQTFNRGAVLVAQHYAVDAYDAQSATWVALDNLARSDLWNTPAQHWQPPRPPHRARRAPARKASASRDRRTPR